MSSPGERQGVRNDFAAAGKVPYTLAALTLAAPQAGQVPLKLIGQVPGCRASNSSGCGSAPCSSWARYSSRTCKTRDFWARDSNAGDSDGGEDALPSGPPT